MISINDFGPFNSEVWGSVSDWAMVIVTGITAYFLFKTLASQVNVQKLQQKATDIENEKFRVEIMPVYEFAVHDHIINSLDEENLLIKIDYLIKLKQNDSYDSAFPAEAYDYENEPFQRPLESNYQQEGFETLSTNTHKINKSTFIKLGLSDNLNIVFHDSIGNRYKQSFCCKLTYENVKIDSFKPKRIFL